MAKSKIKIDKDTSIGKLANAIMELSATQGLNTAFTTFLELFATGLAAEADFINAKKRKERYDLIEKNLEPKVLNEYTRLCVLTFLAIRENKSDPKDILGEVYHTLNLNNEWCGQFFTPDDVSRLMALLVNPVVIGEEEISTINEPTCGSGTMVIGAAWAMLQQGVDYSKRSLFICQDIDIRCVWMAYIQLTLYKIPAVIIHGNTLTNEEWDKWYTPHYYIVAGENQDG